MMKKLIRFVVAAAALAVVGAQAAGFASMADGTWPCGASGSDLTCTKEGDTLTVSGTGAMKDYHNTCAIDLCYSPWGPVSKVVVGEGVTYIGGGAFGNSRSLKEVTVSATTPPAFGSGMGPYPLATFGNDAFPNTITSVILRVPQSSLELYRTANVWKDFGYFNPSTVTFDTGIDTYPHDTQLVSYGDTATKPADDPTRPNFAFVGWYKNTDADPMRWNFNTPIIANITLLAHWNSTTSVASRDRVIPSDGLGSDAVGALPVSKLAAEFTAGPNPAAKSSGGVAFFRRGVPIVSASLAVYNADGNVVKKLLIRDNAVGTQSKRRVGSWDLKDADGRLVPGGTYLIKGVIKTGGKKSEPVSVVVGVR